MDTTLRAVPKDQEYFSMKTATHSLTLCHHVKQHFLLNCSSDLMHKFCWDNRASSNVQRCTITCTFPLIQGRHRTYSLGKLSHDYFTARLLTSTKNTYRTYIILLHININWFSDHTVVLMEVCHIHLNNIHK